MELIGQIEAVADVDRRGAWIHRQRSERLELFAFIEQTHRSRFQGVKDA
jgi:hypothetical protein